MVVYVTHSISQSAFCIHAERNIDGSAFVSLRREDIALVFPGSNKFLLGKSTGPPKKKTRITSSGFKLPKFSTDIERCICNDSFYTQRNKIIRESCTALYGYCREKRGPR